MKRTNRVFRKIVEPIYVIFSVTVTLLSALWCSLANIDTFLSSSLQVAMGFFLVGISSVILQILITVSICKETLEDMKVEEKGIILPKDYERPQSELNELLNSSMDISKVKIICYGTSGYGKLFERIIEKQYNHIKWDIMVCSADEVFHSLKADRDAIEKNMSALKNYSNVNFTCARFLPTIRACVVYDEDDRPVWSCLQTYFYREGMHLRPSAFYKCSYALVGRSNNPVLLSNNVKIIEDEYERLSKP